MQMLLHCRCTSIVQAVQLSKPCPALLLKGVKPSVHDSSPVVVAARPIMRSQSQCDAISVKKEEKLVETVELSWSATMTHSATYSSQPPRIVADLCLRGVQREP
jgi:hypothetical protein